eukprot:CAMPEP_0183445492 /NCGR_PEP_ID=MMETSP0370-20130417/96350_1 /TAXON_ID=268820 /ORGANISM="Peridinium aciculiferum, Strain PAER-2" /LENGTH=141 /DNA_ID=CAMNT_0025636073 /DNA_START=528 /DNA_END=950 /DNA_ORIENTATION=+
MLDLGAPLEPRLWVDLLELTAPPEVLRELEPRLRADLPVRQLPVSQSSPEHACSHTPMQVEGTWRSSSSFSLHLSGKRGNCSGAEPGLTVLETRPRRQSLSTWSDMLCRTNSTSLVMPVTGRYDRILKMPIFESKVQVIEW